MFYDRGVKYRSVRVHLVKIIGALCYEHDELLCIS